MNYIIQVIDTSNFKAIFEYYCFSEIEANWIAKTLREVTDKCVTIQKIIR